MSAHFTTGNISGRARSVGRRHECPTFTNDSLLVHRPDPHEHLLDIIIDEACLDPEERRVVQLVRDGHAFHDIGQMMGKTAWRPLRVYHNAMRKMSAAKDTLCTRARAAYLESQRPPYAQPKHCPPGHEACAKDGICKLVMVA